MLIVAGCAHSNNGHQSTATAGMAMEQNPDRPTYTNAVLEHIPQPRAPFIREM